MISTFNGRRRSLGTGEVKDFRLTIDVEMRKYLHLFKGSSWTVFTCIALHIDGRGWAYPTVETITTRTGLSEDTVYSSLSFLCGGTLKKQIVSAMKIKASRVMLRTQQIPPHISAEKLKNKRPRNFYLIFPSNEEVTRFDETCGAHSDVSKKTSEKSDTKIKTSEKSDTKISGTKNNYALKDQPKILNKELTNTHTPDTPSLFTEVELSSNDEEKRVCVSEEITEADYYAFARATPSFTNPDAWAMKHVALRDADLLIREWKEKLSPARIAEARAMPVDNGLSYFEAERHIRSILSIGAGHNVSNIIEQLQIGAGVRERLIEKFITEGHEQRLSVQ